MNKRELRIGNLVKILPEKSGRLREVIELKESELTVWIEEDESLIELPYAGIIPVKISSEIIESLGFELHDYDLFDESDPDFDQCNSKCTMLTYKLKPQSFNRMFVGVDLFEEDEYCQVFSFNPLKKNNDGNLYHHFIENLHQLQNIYFAITGEELELKKT